MRNVRRRQVEHNRKIRQLVFLTFGILIVVYLTLTIIIGDNGLLRYLKLRSVKENLMGETVAMKNQNEDIKSQVESLQKNPNVVEELAREYGLTKKGELIFKFDDQK